MLSPFVRVRTARAGLARSLAPLPLQWARMTVAVKPPSVAAATSALRCALLFAGCTAPPSARMQALLGMAAQAQGADDLDAASASFESTIRNLRGAAGFGDSPAWHDATLHPWAALLEKEAGVVQAELQAALGSGSGGAGGGAGDGAGDGAGGGATWDGAEYKAIASAWRFQHLWQDGQWVAEAAAQFPRTVALLQRLEAQHGLRLNPLQNVACGFARQPAGSGIAPHCDGNLLGLTAHLGLQVPG